MKESMDRSYLGNSENEYQTAKETKSELRRKALEKAKIFFTQNRTKLEEFKGLEQFPQNILEKDIYITNKIKSKIEESEKTDENKQWSTIQEAIILDQFELSEWFGSTVKTIRPTDHADYIQGVDGVLKFDDLELAFDASYKQDPYGKIHDLKKFIDSGELKLITYFSDEDTGFKGSVNLPIIILGFSRENLFKIAQLWLNAKNGIPESQKLLGKDPIQMLPIYQSLIQLSAYELYCKLDPSKTEELETFSEIKLKVLDIYNQKVSANPELKNLIEDDFTDQLINSVTREYNLKLDDVKNNIWPKPVRTGKIINLRNKPQPTQKAA